VLGRSGGSKEAARRPAAAGRRQRQTTEQPRAAMQDDSGGHRTMARNRVHTEVVTVLQLTALDDGNVGSREQAMPDHRRQPHTGRGRGHTIPNGVPRAGSVGSSSSWSSSSYWSPTQPSTRHRPTGIFHQHLGHAVCRAGNPKCHAGRIMDAARCAGCSGGEAGCGSVWSSRRWR
jgi:hypothetical protein